MFDEIIVMASMGLVNSLFKYLFLPHCLHVFFQFEGVIQSMVVTWALGLKKMLKSQGF